MSVKVFFAILFTGIFALVSCDAQAHTDKSECDKLMEKLPPKTKLDRVNNHSCEVQWSTYNGYASSSYIQKHGCTFIREWKDSYRNLPGRDIKDNNREYKYSGKGFYWNLYYSCPVPSTINHK